MDFCYDPSAPIILPTTEAATTSAPEEELAGCSAEVRACPGTTVLVYQNPAKNCEFDLCPGESTSTSSSATSASTTTSPGDDFSTTEATSVATASTTTSSGDDFSTTEATSVDTSEGTKPPNSSTHSPDTTTEAGAVTCDTLCLNELPSTFCPTEMDELPNCLNIEIGHICEASGECATSDSLNNCQTFDVYVRVECGGDTPSQGYLMKNPAAAQIPVTTVSPLTTANVQGDNETFVSSTIVSDTSISTPTIPENATATATIPAPNVTLPEVSSVDIVFNLTHQTTVPSIANITLDENLTEGTTNLTLQTGEEDIVSAAAASFTYDRSPNGDNVAGDTNGDSFAGFSTQDYSDADSWASDSQSSANPYDNQEGWDLTYFTPSAISSARVNSRGVVFLLGAIVAFVVIV